MRLSDGESGQATIEWAGLVLGVALILGALLAGGREAAQGKGGRELGKAVAERITCAARAKCGDGVGVAPAPSAGAPALLGASASPGRAPASTRRAPASPRGAPLRHPLAGRLPTPSPSAGRRWVDAVGLLGRAKPLLKRAWFPCLAYRSWQDDRENPRVLGQPRSLRRSVEILNECVNPVSFLFGK